MPMGGSAQERLFDSFVQTDAAVAGGAPTQRALLTAGAAVIGKVSIDQTTPGTTDSVTVATAQGAGAAIGATSGAAVITDANGTIQQYLRGIITFFVTGFGGAVANVAAATGFLRALGIRQYLATLPTLTDTRYQHGLVDINGADQTNLATLLAGEDQTYNRMMTLPKYSVTVITTQTTTVIKASAGIIKSIQINTPVANAVVEVYDNASGAGTRLMPTMTMPAVLLNNGPMPPILIDGIATTGITVITSGATMGVGVSWL